MLLVIDVGNTNIVVGVMKAGELIANFRLTTQMTRTSDEYGVTLVSMLGYSGIERNQIKDVIIGSVVPDIMYSLINSIKKYFEIKPMIVSTELDTGIVVKTDNPKEVGVDRIINCVAGYQLFGGPCMVIDFGTATTYDVINEKGEFIAGITSPGIRICADALWSRAAQLPQIEIKKPKRILDAKNTVVSMQAGLVYGYIGQVEYIVGKTREELGAPDMKVIATGGLAKIIQEGTDVISSYDPLLTLKGLEMIHERNKK